MTPSSLPTSKFFVLVLVLLTVSVATPNHGFGQTAYFDLNGATAGSGVLNGSINSWNTSASWSDASLGNVGAPLLHSWINGDVAVFSAGADAANLTYTVQPTGGAVLVSGVTVEEGNVTISNAAGGSFALGSNSVFNVVNTNGAALNVAAAIGGAGFNFTKQGLGTLTLSGNNTYSGTTTINAGGGTVIIDTGGSLASTTNVTINNGGTLLLGAGTGQINDAATVTLNGGNNAVANIQLNANNTNETVGVLTLSSSSVIDFGALTGTNNLIFADSSGAPWTGTLSIWNWTDGTDHLYFGNVTGSGLTTTQLSQIDFYSDSGTTFVGNGLYHPNGEVSPVPEPSTILAGLTLLSLAAFRERRWFLRCREAREARKPRA